MLIILWNIFIEKIPKIITYKSIQNKDNNIENNSLINSQIKKSHSRSLTPKSQRESRINLLKEKNDIDINQINKDNNQSNTDIFNNNDNEKK